MNAWRSSVSAMARRISGLSYGDTGLMSTLGATFSVPTSQCASGIWLLTSLSSGSVTS